MTSNNTEWWRGSVTYQVYPRSFQDTNGDGIGDLPGITARLPHIASLGVDALWLSPIFRSPMADMGYDVSDYRDVDPLFGTLTDFDELVERAHELELKVIIDQVISHSSDLHPWFVESRASRDNPLADWYVWADPQPDGSPPNNWLSVFGGSAWEWDTRRRQYYLHNFLASQPDLNFHNPDVRQAMLDAMRFWLDRGVDGFRLDTVNFYFHDDQLRPNPARKRKEKRPETNPYEMQSGIYSKNRPENRAFLKDVRRLMDEYEARTLVGEVGDSENAVKIMADYTAGNDRLHMAYSFDLLGPTFTAAHIRERVEGFFAEGGGWPNWVFSNHDVPRHVTRWREFATEPDALATLCAAILLSLEGSVCLYQGEELGMPETEIDFHELTDPPGIRFWPEYKGRDGCRTPMVWTDEHNGGFSEVRPWLPVKAPQRACNAAAQESDADSVLNFYRTMLAFRRAEPAFRIGKGRFIDLPEPLLALERQGVDGGEAWSAVFNLSATPQTIKLSAAVDPEGPSRGASRQGKILTLAGNGFAFVQGTGIIIAS